MDDHSFDTGRPVIQLRPSQIKVYSELWNSLRSILNAATGWGKSVVVIALIVEKMLADPLRKTVICIPQHIIAKGFLAPVSIQLPDGRIVNWEVRHNLCRPIANKTKLLRSFLLSPAGPELSDRIIVTSHSSLARAFKKMTAAERKNAAESVTFVIDEAHHVQVSQEENNQLGFVLNEILPIPKTQVVLATAFFFRGDRLPILQDDQLKAFRRVHVPFDEYWSGLRHLKSYTYDFICYAGTPWEDLEDLLRTEQSPTIIYCPPAGHPLLLGKSKQEWMRRLIATVRKHYVDCELWTPATQASDKRVIIDFVDTAFRAEKVAFVMDHGEKVAAVLTVRMFREGADWVQAQRVLDLIPSYSDQDRNQRFGRIIRDCPGKERVQYVSFFPASISSTKEEQRICLTRLFAHFQTTLILSNAIAPLLVPKDVLSVTQSTEPNARPQLMCDFFGQLDGNTQQDVLKGSFEELIRLALNQESSGTTIPSAEAKAAIRQVLTRHNVLQHQEEIAKQIVLLLRRHWNPTLPINELVAAGFDKVWSTEALEELRRFSSGVTNSQTFEELRSLLEDDPEERWHGIYSRIRQMPSPLESSSPDYRWISLNKYLHSKGELPEDKIRLLEKIVWWTWRESIETRWQSKYDAVRVLPRCPKSRTPEYAWIRSQRLLFKRNKLSRERIEACEAIPWWTWENTYETWDEEFERISASGPPSTDSADYEWVKYHRRRMVIGKLAPEKIRLLESIPWWTWSNEVPSWADQYARIRQLPQRPKSRTRDFNWVSDQRRNRRKGKLTDEQIRMLEEISWWTWGWKDNPLDS